MKKINLQQCSSSGKLGKILIQDAGIDTCFTGILQLGQRKMLRQIKLTACCMKIHLKIRVSHCTDPWKPAQTLVQPTSPTSLHCVTTHGH